MLSVFVCTHRLLLAPVRSYWGTTPSCRSASLPTSPHPPAWSHRWRHPWRRRAHPRWSAGRRNVLWPAAGRTRRHPTCPTMERRGRFNGKTQQRLAGVATPALAAWLTRLRYWSCCSLEERLWVFRESNDLIRILEECGTHTPSPGTDNSAGTQQETKP